jgi:methylmalonyl-CoA/ethylmalonyl-CoA epimerase
MTEFWADRLFQIGYVVPSLRDAMRYFHNKLGVPKFLVIENTSLSDQEYLGQRADFRQSIAFCFSGATQIELIEPLSGPSTYTEYLKTHPEGGVQHIGYRVDDLDRATAAMLAKGYRVVHSGRAGKTRLAYFHTTPMFGTAIELLEIEPAELEKFERLRRGEIGIVP